MYWKDFCSTTEYINCRLPVEIDEEGTMCCSLTFQQGVGRLFAPVCFRCFVDVKPFAHCWLGHLTSPLPTWSPHWLTAVAAFSKGPPSFLTHHQCRCHCHWVPLTTLLQGEDTLPTDHCFWKCPLYLWKKDAFSWLVFEGSVYLDLNQTELNWKIDHIGLNQLSRSLSFQNLLVHGLNLLSKNLDQPKLVQTNFFNQDNKMKFGTHTSFA